MPILIAFDGSSHGEASLFLGAQIAQRGSEPLTILTVLKNGSVQASDSAKTVLAHACEIVRTHCPEVRTRVRTGHPAAEIVREAEEGDYDLVIVGDGPNRNLVARFLHGSTAVRVVEHAPCPVIVAKGSTGRIHRILLCDSGSEDPAVGLPSEPRGSDGTVGLGPSVLSRFTALPIDLIDDNGTIVVLHVMSQISGGPGVTGRQLRFGTEQLMDERAPEGELLGRDIGALERLGLRARAKVRHGLVVEEILEEVHNEDYDLVAIGAYRGQGWRRILLDDLAHRIVVELDRPVLVLR